MILSINRSLHTTGLMLAAGTLSLALGAETAPVPAPATAPATAPTVLTSLVPLDYLGIDPGQQITIGKQSTVADPAGLALPLDTPVEISWQARNQEVRYTVISVNAKSPPEPTWALDDPVVRPDGTIIAVGNAPRSLGGLHQAVQMAKLEALKHAIRAIPGTGAGARTSYSGAQTQEILDCVLVVFGDPSAVPTMPLRPGAHVSMRDQTNSPVRCWVRLAMKTDPPNPAGAATQAAPATTPAATPAVPTAVIPLDYFGIAPGQYITIGKHSMVADAAGLVLPMDTPVEIAWQTQDQEERYTVISVNAKSQPGPAWAFDDPVVRPDGAIIAVGHTPRSLAGLHMMMEKARTEALSKALHAMSEATTGNRTPYATQMQVVLDRVLMVCGDATSVPDMPLIPGRSRVLNGPSPVMGWVRLSVKTLPQTPAGSATRPAPATTP